MTSFNITTSAVTTVTQTLSLGLDTGFIGVLAVVNTGDDSGVEIAASAPGAFLVNNGTVMAGFGAVLAHASFRLVNTGQIIGEGIAIYQEISSSAFSSTTIQNTGSILSTVATAISMAEGGLRLTNVGTISGYDGAISVGTTGSDTNEITNSGTIAVQLETGFAIEARNALRLINTGDILGGVMGSSQADIIDTRYGTITGSVLLGDGDNMFRGGSGDETTFSGAGNDTQYGADGNDTMSSGAGQDFLFGGKDDDILSSSAGDNQLYGGLGDDVVFGGTGKDQVKGGGGNDILQGHLGKDDLFGGSGADEFRFTALADSKANRADVIHDMEHGIDLIDLSALTGTLTFAGLGPLSGGGTRSVAYTKAGGGLTVSIDGNGDGTADMVVVVLGAGQLTAGDFAL